MQAPSIRLGIWNFYFVAKLLMFWRDLIDIHPLENIAFAALLLAPVRSAKLRLLRHLLALPAALGLLYYDSWLPPITRVVSEANRMTGFSLTYLIELLTRFVSLPVLAMLVIAWAIYSFAAHYLRIGVLVVAALLGIAGARLAHDGAGAGEVAAAPAPGAAGTATSGAAQPAKGNDALLQEFFAKEAQRSVAFVKADESKVPFDLLFIHVCSLSWDDLRAVGLDQHRIWKKFDFMLRQFNAVSSYSGPAAIRINRATCGQSTHTALYSAVPEQCLLMPSLRKAGFESALVMNHDGHFDDFLAQVQGQGLQVAAMPLTGLPVPLRAFDDSAIYGDLAVLSRWMETRSKNPALRMATYYNSVTLHDGNRLAADPKRGSRDTYKQRVEKLLDDLDEFMVQLAASGRKVIVALVPEHGAAFAGDKMQISGLREIATPAITLVPVGIKVIGKDAKRNGEAVQINEPSSFLALSRIMARLIEKSPFAAEGFAAVDYAADLPQTDFVSENQAAVIIRRGDKYFMRQGKDAWIEYMTR